MQFYGSQRKRPLFPAANQEWLLLPSVTRAVLKAQISCQGFILIDLSEVINLDWKNVTSPV